LAAAPEQYRRHGETRIMTAAPAIKGWCPSLLSPMPSGDGWLARIKPTAATVTADAARLIADAASRHGNGHIDLTRRANLQIRGLTPRSAERLAEIIIAQGLASANPAIEAIRNVMASPLGPDDASAALDAHALAREIEAMLSAETALQALPSKFGVLVDGGGALPLADLTADIIVLGRGNALAVQLDSGALAVNSAPRTLADTVKALALAFLRLPAGRREPPRRMRALVASVGEQAIFEAAGFSPLAEAIVPAPAIASPISFIPYPGKSTGAFGAGAPFGRIDGHALRRLAECAERFGDGTLRLTPWRALLVPGVAAENTGDLTEAIRETGLITEPADPRRHIFACVGAPACPSGTVDARADASRLAAAVAATWEAGIHVSGCAKACAHRGAAAITLVGRDGRYDLIRNGSAGDEPALTGLNIGQAVTLLRSRKGHPR
jgi:precorrin-3B synthase